MMKVEHSSETDSLAYEEWAKERRDSTNVNYVETGCIIWHSIEKEGFPPEQTCEKYLISVENGYTGKKLCECRILYQQWMVRQRVYRRRENNTRTRYCNTLGEFAETGTTSQKTKIPIGQSNARRKRS